MSVSNTERVHLGRGDKPLMDRSWSEQRIDAILARRPVTVLMRVKLTLAIGRLARDKDDARNLLEACGLIPYVSNARRDYRYGQAS